MEGLRRLPIGGVPMSHAALAVVRGCNVGDGVSPDPAREHVLCSLSGGVAVAVAVPLLQRPQQVLGL